MAPFLCPSTDLMFSLLTKIKQILQIFIVCSGFKEEDTVKCFCPNIDTSTLKVSKKMLTLEWFSTVYTQILLVSHLDKMRCKQLWMKGGMSKKSKYLPIHTTREHLKQSIPQVESILSFHSIMGCDTVSYFAGHSKKTVFKTFTEHQMFLKNLRSGDLDSFTMTSVEKFICRICSVTEVDSCNEVRATLLSRCRSPEALPLTSDAVIWHIQRGRYQAMIWKQAHVPHPSLPLTESLGGLGWMEN